MISKELLHKWLATNQLEFIFEELLSLTPVPNDVIHTSGRYHAYMQEKRDGTEDTASLRVEYNKIRKTLEFIINQLPDTPSTPPAFSPTEDEIDPSAHLLDKMYILIRKLDGLPYFNPNLIGNAKPFYKSTRYFTFYDRFNLKSDNPEIRDFFKEIHVELGQIVISPKLASELQAIEQYEYKIKYICKRLSDCGIHTICGFPTHCSEVWDSNSLDTYFYKKLDFKAILKKLKTREGQHEYYSLETGYYHYLLGTDNYKKSYLIFKKVAEQAKGKNNFTYFIAHYNLRRLYGYIFLEYRLDDKDKIIDDIESIDLETILFQMNLKNTIERTALTQIRDDSLKFQIALKVDDLIDTLKKPKISHEEAWYRLSSYLFAYAAHYEANYIIEDYCNISEKILQGYLASCAVHQKQEGALFLFGDWHIYLMVFKVKPDELEKWLNIYDIHNIRLDETAKTYLLTLTTTFLSSNHVSHFGKTVPYQDVTNLFRNILFQLKYKAFFGNLLILLSNVDLESSDCRKIIPSLIHFVEICLRLDQIVGTGEWLEKFITKYEKYFELSELQTLLNLTIDHRSLNQLYPNIVSIWSRYHNECKISNKSLIYKIIETPIDIQLHGLWHICDASNQEILNNAWLKQLESNFKAQYYMNLLFGKHMDINYKDYFTKLISYMNEGRAYYDESGMAHALGVSYSNIEMFSLLVHNVEFHRFIATIYELNIDLKDPRFQVFTDLWDWQDWLLHLETFDYQKFKVEWLLIFDGGNEIFMNKFKKIDSIRERIELAFEKEYPPRLANIYVKYFMGKRV